MYAALGARPDIAHAVSYLARYPDTHTEAHWKALYRILQYIKGTLTYGVRLGARDSPLEGLYAYSDSDWGADAATSRSTCGTAIFFAGDLVYWRSKLQNVNQQAYSRLVLSRGVV